MNFREIETVRGRRRRAPGLAGEYDYAGAVDDVLGPVAGTPVPGLADAYTAGRDAARAELQGAPDMAFSLDETEAQPPPVAAPAPGLAPANEVFASPPPTPAPITPPGAPAAPVSSPPLASAPAAPQVPGGTPAPANMTAPPDGITGINAQAQARQAPAVAPPQPPQPVTTAPTPEQQQAQLATQSEVFSAPGLAGQPMAKDSRASDKMLGRGAPGLGGYGMTQAGDARLAEARQGDRRMRIAQGVLGGAGGLLAMIGAGTNSAPLAGIGMGIRGVGSVIPQGRRAEEVLADYERRRAGVQAQTEADQRAQQLGIEGERVGVERQAAEADMVQAQGQAQLDAANAANAEFERASAEGNAAGMRAAIRARIAAMPDDARKAVLSRQYANGTDLDREVDLGSLRSILDSVEAIDSPGMQIERSRGRGGGGGAAGPMSIDPTTGQIVQAAPPRSAGGRGPAGPTFSDPFAAPVAPAEVPAPATAAPAPRSAGGRRGTTAAAPQGAPASAPAPSQPLSESQIQAAVQGTNVSLNTDLRQRIQDIADTLRDEGIDPASDSGARELRTLLAGLTSDSSGVVTQTEAELRNRQTAANEARAAGQEIGVSPGTYRRLDMRLTPLVRVHREIDGTLRRLRQYRNDHEMEFRAALSGHPVPAQGNAQIYGEILTYFNNRKHAITGAAASDREAAQIMDSIGLNMTAAITDPDAFLGLMQQARDAEAGEIISRSRTIDSRAARRFLTREYPQYAQAFARSLGGD